MLLLYVRRSMEEKESKSIPSKFSNQSQLCMLSDSQKLVRTVWVYRNCVSPMTRCRRRAHFTMSHARICVLEPALSVCISRFPTIHDTPPHSFVAHKASKIMKNQRVSLCRYFIPFLSKSFVDCNPHNHVVHCLCIQSCIIWSRD